MSRFTRILFGNVAPERKRRDLLFVAVPWLLADVITKCLALWWVTGKDLQFLGGNIRLHLSVNEALYSSGHDPKSFGITHAMVVGATLMQAATAAAGFLFGRAEWTVLRKLVLMGLVVVVGPGLGLFLGSLFSGDPHRLVEHGARACGSLAVLFLALRLTRSRYLGLALALWISGNLGNTTNVIYCPRGIIDFIYVPGFRRFLGVFNLADVALEVALGMVLLSPLALVVLRLFARRSERWKHRLEYTNPLEPSAGITPS